MGAYFKILLLLLFTTSSFASEVNVLSCSERGDQTHRLTKTKTGYNFSVSFRIFSIRPEYDPSTGLVSGQGQIGIDVPLENDGVRTTSMRWMNEKDKFFQRLFPAVDLPVQSSVTTGELSLDLATDDCQVKEQEEFIFVSCRAKGPHLINGVEIENVDIHMQNQIRTTLLNDPEDQEELVVSEIEAVYASVSFHKKQGYGTYIYRSSVTYLPDGDETQCLKGDQ